MPGPLILGGANLVKRFLALFLSVVLIVFSFPGKRAAYATAIPVTDFLGPFLTLVGAAGYTFGSSNLNWAYEDFETFQERILQDTYVSSSFNDIKSSIVNLGNGTYKLLHTAGSKLSSFFASLDSYFAYYEDGYLTYQVGGGVSNGVTTNISGSVSIGSVDVGEYLPITYYYTLASNPSVTYSNTSTGRGFLDDRSAKYSIRFVGDSIGIYCYASSTSTDIYWTDNEHGFTSGVPVYGFNKVASFVCGSVYYYADEAVIPADDVRLPFGSGDTDEHPREIWVPKLIDGLLEGRDVIVKEFNEIEDYNGVTTDAIYGEGGLVDVEGDTFVPTYPDITTGLESVGSKLMSILSAIGSLPGLLVGSGDLDFSGFHGVDFSGVFPFCIPFDLIHAVESLSVSSVPPRFEFDFGGTAMSEAGTVVIDFQQFESLAKVVRYFVLLISAFGFALITRRVIKG